MSAVEQAAPGKSGPSFIIQIAVLLVLTLAALGMGWGGGRYLISPLPAEKATSQPSKAKGAKQEQKKATKGSEDKTVVPMDAIITNLAAPSTVWVRLELSLVFDGPADQAIARAIGQDILAYIRTVKLAEVEGPSGFQHLREDLEERASVRSGGRVKKVLIRTLLFE
jgi:flagellar FliL protein